MKSKATYLLLICLPLLFAGTAPEVEAQPMLGIAWDLPEDTDEVNRQLQIFSEHGVQYLELRHPVNAATLDLVDNYNLTVLIRTGKSFLTLAEISRKQNQLLEDYTSVLDRYRSYFNVAAIGLLTNSQDYHPEFKRVFAPVLDSLQSYSNRDLYVYRHNAWYNVNVPDQPYGTLFESTEFQLEDLFTLDSEIREKDATDVLFIPSSWFLEAIELYPELSDSFRNYRENREWVLPLPDITRKSTSPNWIVLLLIMLWGALALQLKYLPYIRPMMMRFFLAHRFYVDDILQYRERVANGSVLIMIKHAIFAGIVGYLCSRILISQPGLEAFFHHLPALSIAGVSYASFFLIGVISCLVIQFLAILWLYLPAKTLEHISQILNLYAGVFYLDFLVITLMVTLFAAGIGNSLVLTLAGIFLFIWFIAFNIAAFDASKNMGTFRWIFLLVTVGLHNLITAGLILVLLINNEWIQVLDLAISL